MENTISTSLIDNVLDTVNGLDEIIRKEHSRRPFNMNIIDELHANENAHTRILIKLLQYSSRGEFPILKSFLCMVNTILMEEYEGDPIRIDIKNPNIIFGQEYIDGLIQGEGQGIIIENKIHYAADQHAQIERYIQSVRRLGIKAEQIFVIYLTRNGAKEIQGYSLTKKAKIFLGFDGQHSGRFIKVNYRDHIIPWLKEDVLPNCPFKEELLISAIKQYIDHLEGLIGVRKNEKKMNDRIKQHLFEKLGINTTNSSTIWKGLSQEREKIQTVLNTVDNIKNEMSGDAYRQLNDWSKEILEDITSSVDEWGPYIGPTFIQNRNKGWKNNKIHFEWWPLTSEDFAKPGFEFRFGLHLEGGLEKLRESVRKEFREQLEKISDLQLFDEPGSIVKHGSALFEKTYYLGEKSFFDTSELEKKVFIREVYKEFADFIKAFDLFIKDGKLK